MDVINLKLYIIGDSTLSKRAIKNIQRLSERGNLKELIHLEVINLVDHPGLAEQEKILAVPLLTKISPHPTKRFIGDLSNTDKLVEELGLEEAGYAPR